MSIYLEEKTVK